VGYFDYGNLSQNSTKFIDVLGDGPTCDRDIPLLARLGINTIVTPRLDPDADHSACMEKLQAAGIYVLFGLTSTTPAEATMNSWNYIQQNNFTRLLDNLRHFENVMGFFFPPSDSSKPQSLPFVRAAAREMKSYIKNKGYRSIPIGYMGTDHGSKATSVFLNCGEQISAIDFYGIIPHPSCSDVSSAQPFLEHLASQYSSYSVPTFLFKFICPASDPQEHYRDLQYLYGNNVSRVFSGGVAAFFLESRVEGVPEPGMISKMMMKIPF
jgi:1,3-beta-glucanosyltransferase GAS1